MASEDVETDMKQNSHQDSEAVPGNKVLIEASTSGAELVISTWKCK